MVEKAPIFDQIYKDYLSQIATVDFKSVAPRLLAETEGDKIRIPLFGTDHTVSAKGIADPSGSQPSHSVSVILAKYLLLCPQAHPAVREWVSYKDFKDAAPFVGGFVSNVDRFIAENFSGRPVDLETACRCLAGRPPESDIGLSYDLAMRFEALPRIPLLLLFNDADEDFPAQCKVLFERRAEKYLDMECLAMVGILLANYLKKALDENRGMTQAV
ncbi:DUF3786 domain-containing protein [Desulfonema ishimotonii]|uniref:DUF3786 domain-containing protein n=1 Tax=Desulfonema ishimotonii TaxID=45657 RepID=A0A401FXN3_9BACT|nr:DUF3786 domain-containing protein [Desulfonema ishimotonii]GBC61737.1 DUF3786 domain-containing protein [Desulfonema ishimotonii]